MGQKDKSALDMSPVTFSVTVPRYVRQWLEEEAARPIKGQTSAPDDYIAAFLKDFADDALGLLKGTGEDYPF